jgi:hypothetical protein
MPEAHLDNSDAKNPCCACVRSHKHSRAEGPVVCTFDDDLAPQVEELRQENEELKAKIGLLFCLR